MMMKMALYRLPVIALLCAALPAAAGEGAHYYAHPGSKAPFSPVVRAGDMLYASGQIGSNADGSLPPDLQSQARLAMHNIDEALKLAGSGLNDVVKCTVMLNDMSKWGAFNEVYVTFFQPDRLPARSAMGVTALAYGAAVEVECMAYKPLK
jgi:reactive intermediate/imine deaminase